MIEKINPEIIPYDRLIQSLCRIPYPGHLNGCINFGKKEGCPPRKLVCDIFDFNKEMYVIFTKFAVGKFAEKMRLEHPEWKERIYIKRDVHEFNWIMNKLRKEHLEWKEKYFPQEINERWKSSRQWYNPRLWQETARKEHKKELEKLLSLYPNLLINRSPEATGVNVTGLMKEFGIKLNWQWPPPHNTKNLSYIVSIAGYSTQA